MAKKAVQMTVLALRGCGPSILREQWGGLPRLQAAPDDEHSGDHDPHREGRALDIVLWATNDYERLFAEMIIEAFQEQREEMQWSAVIYNKVEWDSKGDPHPRIFKPKAGSKRTPAEEALAREKFEHISHIHIEWTLANAKFGDFWLPLTESLRERF